MSDKTQNEFSMITYTSKDGKTSFDVKHDDDTVWLTQQQIAELFEKDRKTITRHISNIYDEDKELDKNATSSKFELVRIEGNRQIKRVLEHYNLDLIISVGYRVKSKRGIQFRQWATTLLRNHILKKNNSLNTSIYINAPITIHNVNIKGNKISVSYNKKEFSMQKTKLIEVLESVHQEIHDNPILKESIRQYQSDIEKSIPGKSTSNRIVHFIKDLGDPNSMTHQVLNGAGIGKSVIKKCFELGRNLLDVLTFKT